MENSWIKLTRGIQKHWVFDDPNYFKAWVTILLNVNFKDGKQLIEGDLIICKRGQSILSLQSWAKLFGKGWTIQKVRTFFKLLQKDNMVKQEGLRKTTRLSVCNYETYQSEQQTANTQLTHSQQTANTQLTTIEESKERKEGKEDTEPNLFGDEKEIPKPIDDKKLPKPPKDLKEVLDYCFIKNKWFDFDAFNFYEHNCENNWWFDNGEPILRWKTLMRSWVGQPFAKKLSLATHKELVKAWILPIEDRELKQEMIKGVYERLK